MMSRKLSATDIESRRCLDWRVVQKMCGGNFQFTAHRTPQDAAAGVNSITREQDARFALHYRARYGIKTLIGPGKYSSYTIIRVDVCDPLYPFTQPSWAE